LFGRGQVSFLVLLKHAASARHEANRITWGSDNRAKNSIVPTRNEAIGNNLLFGVVDLVGVVDLDGYDRNGVVLRQLSTVRSACVQSQLKPTTQSR
jgi:hypothetical protein